MTNYRTERRTISVCDICGDAGPYAETHALVAVMNGEEEHAREILADSTSTELRQLAGHLEELIEMAGDRLGYGGP